MSLFISFEGPDGSGKTTQITLLSNYLKNKGFDVVLTREPGGTAISEKIRQIILDPNNKEMDDMAEALLYAASRAQHVAQLIAPALAQGKYVLSDRFVDSSIAYQGYGRNLGDCVRVINEYAVGEYMPDITFFLDIDPRCGLERANGRESLDRLELEGLDFHYQVYEGYKKLERIYPDRFKIINADRDSNSVFEDIVKIIEDYIVNHS